LQASETRGGQGPSGFEWRRKEVCDDTGIMELKLWDASADSLCQINTKRLVKNVEVEKFKGRTMLSSTPKTTCKVPTWLSIKLLHTLFMYVHTYMVAVKYDTIFNSI